MNILIDINHPAHVHYFRNLYRKLSEDGHQVTVVSRNKEIEQELLEQYGIPFISRGKGASSLVGKIFYQFYAVLFLLRIMLKFKVDVSISFMHPYAAQAAWLLRKKSILFSDTENAGLHHKMSVPFASEIHTPKCFEIDLGRKHRRFEGFMELSYLHPDYFQPEPSVLDQLEYEKNKPIVIVRFVSWKAVHDVGHQGISEEDKVKLVNELAEVSNVFISSESPLPDQLKKYALQIVKSQVHSLLFYSDLFLGESATMASESAMLGTPAIYFDNEGRGYTNYLESKYSMVFNFSEQKPDVKLGIEKAKEILANSNDFNSSRERIIMDSVSTTEYMYSLAKDS